MRAIVGWVTAVLWIVAATASAWGAEPRLVVVVIDKVTWGDLLDDEVNAPTIRSLSERGGVGMMCVRSGRGYGGEYVTIGAASRAGSLFDSRMGNGAEALAFDARERVSGVLASEVFLARTGWSRGESAVVHLGIGPLLRENANAAYPLRIGLLGETLREAGIRIACIGNGDTSTELHREAVSIVMDERGLVALGQVGKSMLRPDPHEVHGVSLNADQLVSSFVRFAGAADLVIVDPGETTRVEVCADAMTPSQLKAARRQAVEVTDRVLARILAAAPRSSILILTPSLRGQQPGENFAALTPIIWRPAEIDGGLLTSPSTRRPGIVVNTDVAPTILRQFGIVAPVDAIGRSMVVEPGEVGGPALLARDMWRHDQVERARRVVFRSIPIAAALMLFLSAFFLWVGERVPSAGRSILRGLMTVLMAMPAALLLVALRPMSATEMALAGTGLAVAIALAGGWLTGWRSTHVLPALLTVGLLAYDMLRGQQMLYWSPLSYSPAAGARFYGLGNEYAGALFGAALVSASAVLSPRERSGIGERIVVAFGLIALAIITGLPRFGANLGMSMAFGFGAAVFILYMWREDIGWPETIAAGLAAIVLLAAAIVIDFIFLGPEASHIGRWIMDVRATGWEAAAEALSRKAAMNWQLVRVSLWTDAAFAALAVLAVAAAVRPPKVLAAARERDWLAPSVIACVVGATAAFALNDSGIVSAALALMYGAGALVYVSLGDVGLEF